MLKNRDHAETKADWLVRSLDDTSFRHGDSPYIASPPLLITEVEHLRWGYIEWLYGVTGTQRLEQLRGDDFSCYTELQRTRNDLS